MPGNLLKLKWSTWGKIPFFWSPVHFKPVSPRAKAVVPYSRVPRPGTVLGSGAGHLSKGQHSNGSPCCRVTWAQMGADKRLCIQVSTEETRFSLLYNQCFINSFTRVGISLCLCVSLQIGQTSRNGCRMVRWFAAQTHPLLSLTGNHPYQPGTKLLTFSSGLQFIHFLHLYIFMVEFQDISPQGISYSRNSGVLC